jgi:hypothetical protein
MKTVRQRYDDEWSTIKDAAVVDFVHTVPVVNFVHTVPVVERLLVFVRTVAVVEGMIQMIDGGGAANC